MIPYPILTVQGFINNTVKNKGHWFANVTLLYGSKHKEYKSLLMQKGALFMAEVCVDIEGCPMHETQWAKQYMFKFEIELRPKYDGVLLSVLRVHKKPLPE